MENIKQVEQEIKRQGKVWKKITFYYTGGEYEKKIGELYIGKKERVYFKKVDSTIHKMRVLDGYGIQKEVFDEFLKGHKTDNDKIIIDETDTGVRYKAPIRIWEEHGVYRNYGEEKQIFVSVKFFKPPYGETMKPVIT